MSKDAFAVVLLAGAGILAIWLEVRFPKLGPRDLRRASVHVAAAVLTLVFAMPAGMDLMGAGDSRAFVLAAIFGVALPALTYSLLVSVWVLKVAQRALGGASR